MSCLVGRPQRNNLNGADVGMQAIEERGIERSADDEEEPRPARSFLTAAATQILPSNSTRPANSWPSPASTRRSPRLGKTRRSGHSRRAASIKIGDSGPARGSLRSSGEAPWAASCCDGARRGRPHLPEMVLIRACRSVLE